METNMNLPAPIAAMALLGTGFIFVVAALGLIVSLILRKFRFTRVLFLLMVIVAVLYAGAIVAFALVSHERMLARGQEKHFCEIDCHLAYSIVNTRQTKTLGDPPNQSTAQGSFTVVTIKTRFDETTIAPWRGNGSLYPNSRVVTLIDGNGNRYSPASQAGTPLTSPLRPGGSYTSDIAFDLPANAKPTAVLINEGDWITHLVIGHENSPLHKQAKFQL